MLTPYRRVLSEPGALAFSGAALVARLPISMIGLGIVLLISTVTGSYGLAGSVSAVFLISNALLTVPQGRLLDQWGQARVLTTAIALETGKGDFALALALGFVLIALAIAVNLGLHFLTRTERDSRW